MDFDQNQEFGHFGKVTPGHHSADGFRKCHPWYVLGLNTHFFQGKKMLPNVGIFQNFRKISRIRLKMTPVYEYGFIFCENLSH